MSKKIDPKTDYKKLFNSQFLNDGDFTERETIVKIIDVHSDTMAGGNGNEEVTVVLLEGYKKPLKLVNEMMDILHGFTNDREVGSWIGQYATVYILHGLRAFGGTHNVPRFRKAKPRIAADTPYATKEQLDLLVTYMSADEIASYCSDQGHEHLGFTKTDKAQALINYYAKQNNKEA
tara:strand:+ start:1338 stop:1868 length:531 start_codon:yes stop_codon:yes gene_type:complete